MDLLAPFQHGYMLRALLAIALVAILAATVGVWLVLRRMALIGDALAHAALPGIVLARWAGVDLLLGALIADLLAVAGVAGLSRRGRLHEDTALAILMAGCLALGIALAQGLGMDAQIGHLLFGSVLGVQGADLVVLATVTVVVCLGLGLVQRPLELATYDGEFAELAGYRGALLRLLLLAGISLAAITAARLVGVLLTSALLVAPAAGAALLCKDLPRLRRTALGLALGFAVGGVYASWWLALPPGVVVASLAALGFLAIWVGTWRRA